MMAALLQRKLRHYSIAQIMQFIDGASKRSFPAISNAGRTASQNDRQISPTSALFTNWNPLSFIPIRNSGIFRLKFVIHSGMPPGTTPSVHSFTGFSKIVGRYLTKQLEDDE